MKCLKVRRLSYTSGRFEKRFANAHYFVVGKIRHGKLGVVTNYLSDG